MTLFLIYAFGVFLTPAILPVLTNRFYLDEEVTMLALIWPVSLGYFFLHLIISSIHSIGQSLRKKIWK